MPVLGDYLELVDEDLSAMQRSATEPESAAAS